MGPARSRRWRWVSAQAWLGSDAAAAFLGCSWGLGYYFSRIKVFRGGREGDARQEKGPLSVLTIPLDPKVHAHRLQSSRKAGNLCQQGAEVTRRPRDLRSPRPSRIVLCSPSVFLLQARQMRPPRKQRQSRVLPTVPHGAVGGCRAWEPGAGGRRRQNWEPWPLSRPWSRIAHPPPEGCLPPAPALLAFQAQICPACLLHLLGSRGPAGRPEPPSPGGGCSEGSWRAACSPWAPVLPTPSGCHPTSSRLVPLTAGRQGAMPGD